MASDTWMIVGLGNPGQPYEHTRHNAGFDTVDLIAKELGVNYWKTKSWSHVGEATYHGKDVVLVKPHTHMNLSGGAVKALMRDYDVDTKHLIVVHDDLDINPAMIRVKFGGGLAGHNGLRSINEKLHDTEWYRVRIGIGRPPGRMPVVDWVLTRPKASGAEDFRAAVGLGAEATLYLLDNGLQETQQKYN